MCSWNTKLRSGHCRSEDVTPKRRKNVLVFRTTDVVQVEVDSKSIFGSRFAKCQTFWNGALNKCRDFCTVCLTLIGSLPLLLECGDDLWTCFIGLSLQVKRAINSGKASFFSELTRLSYIYMSICATVSLDNDMSLSCTSQCSLVEN